MEPGTENPHLEKSILIPVIRSDQGLFYARRFCVEGDILVFGALKKRALLPIRFLQIIYNYFLAAFKWFFGIRLATREAVNE